jgi:hypothetical protein
MVHTERHRIDVARPRTLASLLAIAVLLLAALALAPAAAHAAGAPTSLRTEHLSNPLGIDATAPRLSWSLADTTRGAAQTSYRVLVATSAANLAADVGDAWDSGVVRSAQTSLLAYAGRTLQPGTRYLWKVRSWDAGGTPSPWSATASFETGLLSPSDWGGSRWITTRGLARRAFTLSSAATSTRLYVSAKGHYEREPDMLGPCCGEAYGLARGVPVLTLDGRAVGTSVLDPAPVDTRKRTLYTTYDLGALAAGDHVLGIELAEESDVRAVLVARHASGPPTTIVSAADGWRRHTGPVVSANRYAGERHDARLELPGWNAPGFDASAWEPLAVEAYVPRATHDGQGRAVTQLDTTTCCGWSPEALVDGVLRSSGSSQGYHSGVAASANETRWVQVDLGSSQPVTRLELHPARPTNFTPDTPGFGFPVRYRVQVSDDASFATSTTVVDRTGADQPDPGASLVGFDVAPTRGRYVRVTATKLRNSNGFLFALAELSVNPHEAVTASNTVGCCGWEPRFAADGELVSRDGAQGFLARTATRADDPDWLQYDLGASRQVSRVDLYPAQPTNWRDGRDAGHGFPVRYRVEVSDDRSFASSTTVVDRTGADQPNPGSAVQSFEFAPVRGTYVRLTATKLRERSDGGTFVFAVAEMRVGGPPSAIPLTAAAHEPMRVQRTIRPVAITQPSSGVYVVDFGQNVTGRAQLTVNGSAGQLVSLEHGERLGGDGRVDNSGIVAAQTDLYTLRGGGSETWEPRFVYHGFRYVEVTGYPGAVTTASLAARELHTDVASTGTFSSSNALLNDIHAAIRQTQLNALHGVAEDTPTREKRGWMADSHITSEEAIDNFGMAAFYTKFTQDMADAQDASGRVPDFVPTEPTFSGSDPAWGAATVLIPWNVYQRYGDTRLLAQRYDTMRRYVDHVGTMATGYLVDHPTSTWGEDWLSLHTTPGTYFRTGFYHLMALRLSQIAGVLGNAADQSRYAALAANIKGAINTAFLNGSGGNAFYANGSQYSNAFALELGIVPSGDVAAVTANLVLDLQTVNRGHFSGGILGLKYTVDALMRQGRSDVLLEAMTRTDYPSFGWMLARGPGTIWEDWVGDMSRNHPTLGAVATWFYEGLAGLRPDPAGPGYKRSFVTPQVPTGLARAAGSVTTPHGQLTSAWERSGSRLTLTVTVPANTTATIVVPTLGSSAPAISEGGTTVWSGGRGTAVSGLAPVGPQGEGIAFTAQAGSYSFAMTG